MRNNENNLILISKVAINLLEIPITRKNIGNFGIVYHPFFHSTAVPYKEEIIDIFNDKDKFQNYVIELKEHIKKEKDVYRIMFLLNKPYRMYFLYLIQNYLDKQTFATLLKECYTETEFPNHDANVSVSEIKDMFIKADKNLLMDKDEIKIFNKLENELTIYRGFYSNKYYDALSWTLDIDKAHFFATRFSNDTGSIYQANIKKDNIYAYFDCRNEKEIIVDYTKLYNITKKEQFS